MSSVRYENVASSYYEVAMDYITAKEKDEGNKYLKRIVQLEEDIVKTNESSIKPIELTLDTQIYILRAKQMLE